ncbi:DUF4910 domain-containing protein [Cytobacillus sp. FJAT-54145]|uniref:DUF4910 domain-containing protein n=1 Tax=Cytobacillus spartinae TaxID=3299023 RepID=A0ABW6K4Z9_9BACI
MFQEWKKLLTEEISGKQAFRYAERIAQYHRIQASPGYRNAANEVMKLLERDGVKAELVSYPATFGNRFISHHSFKEWSCESAELWIEEPYRKRIARFEEEEISLIQRSICTPEDGIATELVIIDNAEDEDSYKGVDLKGKMALVRGNPMVVHSLAVEKFGAIGLVFDNLNEYPPIRTRLDFPDARQYTSYWWHKEQEQKSFGFVVSPRISEEIRSLAKDQIIQVSAKVNTKLYEGSYENIEFFIPGVKKEEILLVSHLCHPYPGGQDNASGPGTLMEVMRSLTKLIKSGKLPTPELGIRFLMMPEMTGTAAYFEQHPDRIPYTFAALNLDMVGADQSKGGGPLCIEQPPLANPTFVDRYTYKLVEELAANTKNFSGTTEYSTVQYVKTRFSGGSDHYIISDPTIGIPCPMLIQWPDRNYHTTTDTTNNLSEDMMKLVGVITSLYAYGLANGNEDDWILFLRSMSNQSIHQLLEAKDWILKQNFSKEEAMDALTLFTNYESLALEELKKYSIVREFNKLTDHIQWFEKMLKKQIDFTHEMVEKEVSLVKTVNPPPNSSMDDWQNEIYVRLLKGPIRITDEIKALPSEERLEWLQDFETKVPMGYADHLFYWMDGKRSLDEILTLTKYETGMYFEEYTKKLMKLCLDLRLIKFA